MCRMVIRRHLIKVSNDTNIAPYIMELPVPSFIKRQLLLEYEVKQFEADLIDDEE